MFTPHQADAVRRALRKGLDQEGPPSHWPRRAPRRRARG